MKKLPILTGLILFLIPIKSILASDIDTLYARYMATAVYNPTQESITSALSFLNPDGSFSDIDYKSKTDISIHLTRLRVLAGAYQSVSSSYYRDSTIKNHFNRSLQYWITTDHRPSNWWFRHVGYPKALGISLFLMNKELKADHPELFQRAIEYLLWAYNKNDHMEGANGADKIFAALPAAILTENDTLLKRFQQQIKDLIVVQTVGEGIEPDWMFSQHSFQGRQLYANYQQEYLNSILSYLDLCKGTIYTVSTTELTVLDNHIINGMQWYVYKKHQDPAQTGRRPSSTLNPRYSNNLSLMIAQDSPQKEQLLNIQDRIFLLQDIELKLLGNRMFWRFDYMIHRREGYYVSSRLTSTRTIGMESGNGDGLDNYYTSAGLNFIFRTGLEYETTYFKLMNNRQWPGTTAEQGDRKLPSVEWGKNSRNNNPYAGGVSNQNYGTIGFIYDKKNLEATKSWFYFDNEFVALGCGISQRFGRDSVMTTLNQVIQKTPVYYSENRTVKRLEIGSGITKVNNPEWFLQDSIGYINLLDSKNFTISSEIKNKTSLFSLGIEHGKNPKDESYAYVVYPNCSEVDL
ncbi:MAG TPA: polysaccharide lyase family 8 super-sandwich domain-containing protein, partial [Bacteroidales bacterium]|nr:polysaccharide lyase family 8 super-sandwich domain-containing protein [Bacteroidales bacterium]